MTTTTSLENHQNEIRKGERFEFGENWTRFLRVLDEDRIQEATYSLKQMLEVDSLEGKSFLDIGSGSGLFSLAGRRLGAKIFSFDYDPQSVACTLEVKRRYFENDSNWHVEEGSVLDRKYLAGLGKFDVVYSWGVLHHTGAMWDALGNIDVLLAENGKLFIALYNDQGSKSKQWRIIKKTYNKLPAALKNLFAVAAYVPYELNIFLNLLVRLKPHVYFEYILNYSKKNRGMSWWHDHIDWIGGYPFEVSMPEQIFEFYKKRGYTLLKLTTCAGDLGCNQYVFERTS